jgi:hypothetical protein
MPIKKVYEKNWTKYMIDHFVDKGFAIYINTENEILTFISKDFYGLDIALTNLYGFLTISFNNLKLKEEFRTISKIEVLEFNKNENHFFDEDDNFETGKKQIRYVSEKLPCLIHSGVKSNSLGYRFYDLDENKIKDLEDILKYRKSVFEQILKCIEQLSLELKNQNNQL